MLFQIGEELRNKPLPAAPPMRQQASSSQYQFQIGEELLKRPLQAAPARCVVHQPAGIAVFQIGEELSKPAQAAAAAARPPRASSQHQQTQLPFLQNSNSMDGSVKLDRNKVNWTLPDAKRNFATVKLGQHQVVHDVTRTADIDGASAASTQKYVHALRFANKPSFFAPDDVEGSHPRPLVPPRPMGFSANHERDRALSTRDIEHCYPESKLFSTPRIVNPLNPVYNIAPSKVALPPAPPPRCDPLKIDDIPGTHAKKPRELSLNRNTLDTTDIPLSTAGSLTASRKRKTTSQMLETRDITHPPELEVEPFLKNPRGTNPLDPVYKLSAPRTLHLAGVQKQAFQIGPVDGSRSKPRTHERKDRPMLSLRSDDIDGARPKIRNP